MTWEGKRDKKLFLSAADIGLEPLQAIDLSACSSSLALVNAMKKTSFGGRSVGEAHDVLCEMFNDKKSFNVLTLSGAMTAAKMGLIITDLIDKGLIHAVVSTGALITHGLVENMNLSHFKCNPDQNDSLLYQKGCNRIYDTIELEKNLDNIEQIMKTILDTLPSEEICSWKLLNQIGKYLRKTKGRGILKSAYEKNIPVYVPAFTDCELGLDVALYRQRQIMEGKQPIKFDPFLDLDDFAERIQKQETLGVLTIGGGVPRNWAQQVAPYLELLNDNLGKGKTVKYKYGVRICPEPVQWGGLSGCTYSESVSWGKFLSKKEGGKYAEVPADATIVLPLLIRAVFEQLKIF